LFQQVPQRLDEADGGHEDKQGEGREEQPLPEVDLVGWPGARERARNAQKQRELPRGPTGGAQADASGGEAHHGPLVKPEHQVDPRHAAVGKGGPGHCDNHGNHVDPQLLAVRARVLRPAVQPAPPKSPESQPLHHECWHPVTWAQLW